MGKKYQVADAALIRALITWLYQAGPAMSCCTRLAWGSLAGRLHMSSDSDGPPLLLSPSVTSNSMTAL